jgi:hypothetical protein
MLLVFATANIRLPLWFSVLVDFVPGSLHHVDVSEVHASIILRIEIKRESEYSCCSM